MATLNLIVLFLFALYVCVYTPLSLGVLWLCSIILMKWKKFAKKWTSGNYPVYCWIMNHPCDGIKHSKFNLQHFPPFSFTFVVKTFNNMTNAWYIFRKTSAISKAHLSFSTLLGNAAVLKQRNMSAQLFWLKCQEIKVQNYNTGSSFSFYFQYFVL